LSQITANYAESLFLYQLIPVGVPRRRQKLQAKVSHSRPPSVISLVGFGVSLVVFDSSRFEADRKTLFLRALLTSFEAKVMIPSRTQSHLDVDHGAFYLARPPGAHSKH